MSVIFRLSSHIRLDNTSFLLVKKITVFFNNLTQFAMIVDYCERHQAVTSSARGLISFPVTGLLKGSRQNTCKQINISLSATAFYTEQVWTQISVDSNCFIRTVISLWGYDLFAPANQFFQSYFLLWS